MKKTVFIAVIGALALGGAWLWGSAQKAAMAEPRIPSRFASSLPAECRQVILVESSQQASTSARLWLLDRENYHGPWRKAMGPIVVTLGHKGLAWGDGEHQGPAPSDFPIKREGDKCSPAGVFRIPSAFGLAGQDDASWLKLPYTPLTSTIVGVDDPKSKHYNQIVDSTQIERDWDSNEAMMRHDSLYRWGAFIAHNPEGTPGVGSCIFMHIWPFPNSGTSGCTAMAESDLKTVLAWIDPARQPRLVQGLDNW